MPAPPPYSLPGRTQTKLVNPGAPSTRSMACAMMTDA